MAKAYSLDLRQRAVAYINASHTCLETAERFSVSHSSVIRWAVRARSEGSPAAKPMGGKRRDALAGQRDWLLEQVKKHPDLTLHALLRQLERRDCKVACDTLWRFLRSEGMTFKKTLFAEKQQRPDIERRRTIWRPEQYSAICSAGPIVSPSPAMYA